MRPMHQQPVPSQYRKWWVMGQKAWSSDGERRKPIMGFLLRLFWGKCLAGMTCHPKETRMSWNHQVHAMREKERERESTHTVMGRKSHGKQINKIAFFVWQRGAAQSAQVSGGG